uniref:Uncharacterized protein n=1 Tax=Arundo donax TaxID=35708 RepID=A0A0A9BMM2_ARUDO
MRSLRPLEAYGPPPES